MELADETSRDRHAGEGDEKNGQHRGEDRIAARETPEIGGHRGFPAIAPYRDENAEGAEVRDGVRRHVEQQRLESIGTTLHADDPAEHVSGVRDRRESEQSLQVALSESAKVPHDHGEARHERDPGSPGTAEIADRDRNHPAERAERRDLDPGGHERGHGRGGPLVDVGRPHMEGRRAHLEEESHQEERAAHQRERPPQGHTGRHLRQRGAAGSAIQEGDSEQKEGRRERAGDEVLDRGFLAMRVRPRHRAQGVEGHRHDFQGDEERDRLGCGGQTEHAHDREKHQGEELVRSHPIVIEPRRGQPHSQDRHHEDRDLHKGAIGASLDGAAHRTSRGSEQNQGQGHPQSRRRQIPADRKPA